MRLILWVTLIHYPSSQHAYHVNGSIMSARLDRTNECRLAIISCADRHRTHVPEVASECFGEFEQWKYWWPLRLVQRDGLEGTVDEHAVLERGAQREGNSIVGDTEVLGWLWNRSWPLDGSFGWIYMRMVMEIGMWTQSWAGHIVKESMKMRIMFAWKAKRFSWSEIFSPLPYPARGQPQFFHAGPRECTMKR